jgi:Nif-specific regulatory protein
MKTQQATNGGRDNFSVLYEITQSLNSILDPQRLLDAVLQTAMAHLDAERGLIVLVHSAHENGFEVVASKNFAEDTMPEKLAASSSVVTKVLKTGEPVLTFDALSDERFEASRSIVAQKILSIICVPLQLLKKTTGCIYLDTTKARGKFSDETMQFLTIFGSLAGISINNARRYETLRTENERLKKEIGFGSLFPDIIGKSKQWISTLDVVRRIVDTDVSVLITGESGTGKELIARAIHSNSGRKEKPFVAVNCSAIPEQLLESELFGHTKGAFTGASSDKKGLLEHAHGGTLFLDEIGDLPLLLQAKLLRVLQEKEIRRLGDVENRSVDVRIVAATNKDIIQDIKKGVFREDLYFRLNVVGIHLPPLRERKEDIPLFVESFLRASNQAHKRDITAIHPKAMEKLLNHPWYGNVRELHNVIERAVVLCRAHELRDEDLQLQHFTEKDLLQSGTTLDQFERKLVEQTLAEFGGNRTRTAEKLGVSLRWLQYRLKEWSSDSE